MSNRQGNSALLRYGIICIGAILWYSFVWEPKSLVLKDTIMQIESAEARVRKKKRERLNLERSAPEIPRLEAELTRLRGRMIKGETPQITATTIQNMVLEKAKKVDLEVVTYKTINRRKWEKLQLGVSTFTFKGDIKKLTFFFKLLKDEKKLFRVSNLNITRVRGKDPYMRANLEIEALFEGQEQE